jgi:hypothetical protein
MKATDINEMIILHYYVSFFFLKNELFLRKVVKFELRFI